jgi:hypothetical protein
MSIEAELHRPRHALCNVASDIKYVPDAGSHSHTARARHFGWEPRCSSHVHGVAARLLWIQTEITEQSGCGVCGRGPYPAGGPRRSLSASRGSRT